MCASPSRTRQSHAQCLSLQSLARGERTEVVSELRRLPELYRLWIGGRRTEAVPATMAAAGSDNLGACDEAATRIEAGIDVLARNDDAWKAFSLANQAMLSVRSRSDWLRAGRPTPEPPANEDQRWYPFQLGFLLLCVPGIFDPGLRDRRLADLLWFPTGGGKTEAYLGLMAFTLFLRRLRDSGPGGGVTALMRYTLRLLTIQQFERAATFICACESRRSDDDAARRRRPSLSGYGSDNGTPNARRQADY